MVPLITSAERDERQTLFLLPETLSGLTLDDDRYDSNRLCSEPDSVSELRRTSGAMRV